MNALGWIRIGFGLVVGLIAIKASATGLETEVQSIDVLNRVSTFYDIVVDRNGRPHVAYIDLHEARSGSVGAVGDARVRYARFDGWIWREETLGVIRVREDTAVNMSVVLAVGLDGAHVLAVEPGDENLTDDRMVHFHRRTDATVSRGAIASGNVSEPTLAIDAPGVIYAGWTRNRTDGLGSALEVGTIGSNGNLNAITIPTSTQVSSPSLATRRTSTGGLAGAAFAWNECAAGACRQRSAWLNAGVATGIAEITQATADGNGHVRVAINAQNQAEVMLVVGGFPRRVEHRVQLSNGWGCAPSAACELGLNEGLDVDFVPAPHAFVIASAESSQNDAVMRAMSVRLISKSDLLVSRVSIQSFISAAFIGFDVPPGVDLGSVAINDLMRPVTIGRSADIHRDLLAIRFAGGLNSLRVPAVPATILRNAMDMATARDGTPRILGTSASNGDLRLWRWQNGANPDFVSEALPATLDPDAASLAIGPDGNEHVALYDRTSNDLIYVRRAPGTSQGWLTQTVLSAGNAGRSPNMLVYADGSVVIVAVDQVGNVVAMVQMPNGSWIQRNLSQLFPPGASAVPRAVVASAGFLLRATWFDSISGSLMLSSILGDPASAPVLVETTVNFNGETFGRVHDLDLLHDGQPLIAFSRVDGDDQRASARYRRSDGSWAFVTGSPEILAQSILDVRVAAGGGSAANLRLAWVQRELNGGADRLWVALPEISFIVGQMQFAEPDRPAFALEGKDRINIALMQTSGTEVLQIPVPVPLSGSTVFPPGWTGASQVLPPAEVAPVCLCLVLAMMGIQCPGSAPRRSLEQSLSTMAGLQQRFSTTEAGRYYLELFQQHSDEIMALTLASPEMLSERERTWHDLQLGFRALVDGNGASQRFTAENITAARAIMQSWAAAGSPQLQAAVNAELDRLDELNVFVGMNFDQWFAALTVGGNDCIFGHGFENAMP